MARTALGEYIHGLRRKKGYTLKQAAQVMGINFTYLSKIENGHVIPEPDKLVTIARALDGSVSKMMRLSENIPEEVLRSLVEEIRQREQQQVEDALILPRSRAGVIQKGLPSLQADQLIADSLPQPVIDVFVERFGVSLDDVAAIGNIVRQLAQLEPETRDQVLAIINDLVSLNLTKRGPERDGFSF